MKPVIEGASSPATSASANETFALILIEKLRSFHFVDVPQNHGAASSLPSLIGKAARLSDGLKSIQKGTGSITNLIQEMAGFIHESRFLPLAEQSVLAVFIQNIEQFWKGIIEHLSPKLNENDLFLLTGIPPVMLRENDIQITFERYRGASAVNAQEIYLSVHSLPIIEELDSRLLSYEAILECLNKSVVGILPSMPQPSHWPAGLGVVILSVPLKEVEIVQKAIIQHRWDICLPYIVNTHSHPWLMTTLKFNLVAKDKWISMPYKAPLPALNAAAAKELVETILGRGGADLAALELVERDFLFMHKAMLIFLNPKGKDSQIYGHVLSARGKEWFAVTFNNEANMLCIQPTGRGGSQVFLFEKKGNIITSMVFNCDSWAEVPFEQFIPISLATFDPLQMFAAANMTPTTRQDLDRMREIRAIFVQAILGKFDASQSLIEQLAQVTAPQKETMPVASGSTDLSLALSRNRCYRRSDSPQPAVAMQPQMTEDNTNGHSPTI